METKYKYKSLSDFKKDNPKEYAYAVAKNFIEDICNEMGWTYKRIRALDSWTFEECLNEALKHNNKNGWLKASNGSYRAAIKNNWIEQCIAHMVNLYKPKGYWTFERCLEIALKYQTRNEWKTNNQASYEAARVNKEWHDECTKHMTSKNKPNGYWTYERCIEESKKYNTINELNQNVGFTLLAVARKNGWYEECTAHMTKRKITLPKKKKSQGYWTKDRFIIECKKYNSYKDLRAGNPSAVECARSKGYLDDVIKLMGWEERKKYKPIRIKKWSKELCMESALKYKTKVEWEKNDNNAYSASRRNGWYEECTTHMPNLINKRGYWTKEKCMENASQYTVKEKWKKENNAAYCAARKNGWYYECTVHMTNITTPNYWTKERCMQEALKYNTISEWRTNNQSSHNKAKKENWFEECTAHMIKLKK